MSAYDELVERVRRIHAVERAASQLRWDQQVVMPSGGTEARAGELATLHTIAHEHLVDERTGRLLEAAEDEAGSLDERALVREVAWRHERAVRVPTSLVEETASATTRARTAWARAKEQDTFEPFAEHLERLVELKRAYAGHVDPDADPYAVLYEDHEPWLPLERAREAIEDLAEGVRSLVEAAPDPPSEDPFEGPWPAQGQRALALDVLDALGYDLERGRLDESAHPFSTGNVHDARITTRFEEDDPVSALTSTIHEFGHACYTQGLPEDAFGTPLGDARNLVVHESQSRLFENHIARSRPFWDWVLPRFEDAFGDRGRELEPAACYRWANRVRPSLIRVDADELTYHLHIALRTELEEALVAAELTVGELPHAWNERSEALLGLRPETPAEGVLQDVHWSEAAFGYFPTYSLGSMLAAQLAAAFETDVDDLATIVREERFEELVAWLREKVHRHGRRYTTPELVEQATGGPLSAEAMLGYARSKYGSLWGKDL